MSILLAQKWRTRLIIMFAAVLTVPLAAAGGKNDTKALASCWDTVSPTCKVVAPHADAVVSGRAVIKVGDHMDREHRFELCEPSGEQCRAIEPEAPGEFPTGTELVSDRAVPVKAFTWDTRQAPTGYHLLRVSCGEESTLVPIFINREPVADFCLEVVDERTFCLDASTASDPDGSDESLRFSWSVDGEVVSHEQTFEISFAARAGSVPVHLMAEDEMGASTLSPAIVISPDNARTYIDNPNTGERTKIVTQGCLVGDEFSIEIKDEAAGAHDNVDASGDATDDQTLVADQPNKCICKQMQIMTKGDSKVKKRHQESLRAQARMLRFVAAGWGAVGARGLARFATRAADSAEQAAKTIDTKLGDKSGGRPQGNPMRFGCGHAFEVRTEITGTASACEENQGARTSTIRGFDGKVHSAVSRMPGPGGLAKEFPIKKPPAGAALNSFPVHSKKYGWDGYDAPFAGGKYYWQNEIRWYDTPYSEISPFLIKVPFDKLPTKYFILRQTEFVACVRGTDKHRCCCTWQMTCTADATLDKKTLKISIGKSWAKIAKVKCTRKP